MYITSFVVILDVSENVNVWVNPVVSTKLLDEVKEVAVVITVSVAT